MRIDVVKVKERKRYEVTVGGRVVGSADYRVHGDVVVLPHTVVDASMRGRGVAGALVRFALDDIRAAGRQVDPQCSYVAEYIHSNPEYEDLVAPD